MFIYVLCVFQLFSAWHIRPPPPRRGAAMADDDKAEATILEYHATLVQHNNTCRLEIKNLDAIDTF